MLNDAEMKASWKKGPKVTRYESVERGERLELMLMYDWENK